MLRVGDAPSFPSLLLIFSPYRGPPIPEIICISSANHDYPFLSLMFFFCTMLLVYFIQLTSTPSHQCTQTVTVQITAAFIGPSHNLIQLVSAGLGFSEGSCSRAGCRLIETCLVVQPGLPQGGVKNRNHLWKFTDSLTISWLLAKSENSQYNRNNCF